MSLTGRNCITHAGSHALIQMFYGQTYQWQNILHSNDKNVSYLKRSLFRKENIPIH